MSAAPVIPPPTADLSILFGQSAVAGYPVGVDLVCTPEGDRARVLVPVPGGLCFRLDLTRQQLAALMDELVELADVLDVQSDTLTMTMPYGGS